MQAVFLVLEAHRKLYDPNRALSLILFVDVTIREGYYTKLFVVLYLLEQLRLYRSLQ